MSLWLDIAYVKRVSYKLERFVVKRDGNSFLANFRCPFCGDSKKDATKTRGYIYCGDDGGLSFKCWNCGDSRYLSTFLKEIEPSLYKEYGFEKFKESTGYVPKQSPDSTLDLNSEIKKLQDDIPKAIDNGSILSGLYLIKDMNDSHQAKVYMESRLIPPSKRKYFYYAEDFYAWAKTTTDLFDDPKYSRKHPRIIIPWFSETGEIFAYQGRALDDSKPKYITVILDQTKPKLFGLNDLNPQKKIYVLEGPIDSMFLKNSVAVGSSALTTCKLKSNDGIVYCFDNEPRNADIVKLIGAAVKSGLNVFIPPESYVWKDLNDAVRFGGMVPSTIKQMIDENTYSGMMALLKFNNWKRV